MKNAKKITWVVLALLPVISFMILLLSQIGQQKTIGLELDGTAVIPVWTEVYINNDSSGNYTILNYENTEFVTFTEIALYSFTGGNAYIERNSVLGAFIGLYQILTFDTMIPASAITFFGMLYLFYLAFLELVSLLIDLIMFVPRKCGEIFR